MINWIRDIFRKKPKVCPILGWAVGMALEEKYPLLFSAHSVSKVLRILSGALNAKGLNCTADNLALVAEELEVILVRKAEDK